MRVSIEVPVAKGGWLIPCIESVLAQTSPQWELLLAWDQGDALSRRILEQLQQRRHPRIRIFFHEARHGIAANRRLLSAQSQADYILPLDDDDTLAADAVARFLTVADAQPWASVVRARRSFIDPAGQQHAMEDWFPFAPRTYFAGMTADLYNHSQPTLLRRALYNQTQGWRGFDDFMGAGEDCDIIAQLESLGECVLLDATLYFYRVHDKRASNELGAPAAEEMWRRIADRSIEERGLPLRRDNAVQPFRFVPLTQPAATPRDVDVVIAHYPADEEELDYPWRRPHEAANGHVPLLPGRAALQWLPDDLPAFARVEVCCFSDAAVRGTLQVQVVHTDGVVVAAGQVRLYDAQLQADYLSVPLRGGVEKQVAGRSLRITFHPQTPGAPVPVVSATECRGAAGLLLRLYRRAAGPAAPWLERAIQSVLANGVPEEQVHVVAERASSAANRNAGMRRGRARLILILDDDAALRDLVDLAALLDGMQTQGAQLAGPKVLSPDGTLYCAAPYFGSDGLPRPRGLGDTDAGQYDYHTLVTWLPTTCLLLERAVVRACGGFDERYTGSQLEDVDFCLKARSRGFACAYVGSACALHENLQRNFAFSVNAPYFQARWGGVHAHLLQEGAT